MSINMVKGDILSAPGGVVCHQVNCRGVMGAGLANQIRAKNPGVYSKYRSHCGNFSDRQLLGTVLFVEAEQSNVDYIANCFGQVEFGTYKCQTDYPALRLCLEEVHDFAIQNGLSVHVPRGIGCGLAGGDWTVVYAILEYIFESSEVELFVWDYSSP